MIVFYVCNLYLRGNGYTFRESSPAISIFSSPGQSPGRAIVLPPASALALASAAALAKSLTLKFFM